MTVIDFKDIQCLKEGKIKIKERAVNVKYSYNGFGKSSLAKAIYYGIEDKDSLEALTPFGGGKPTINNLENFKSCKIFNEDFVEETLFLEDNLMDGSYNVFVGTKDLKDKERAIDNLLANLDNALDNSSLNQFQIDSEDSLKYLVINSKGDDFDKRKPGYKGLSKAPNISSAALLTSIKDFDRFINNKSISDWLDWHKKGHAFVLDEKCPYCNLKLSALQSTYDSDVNSLLDGMDFKNNKSVRDVVTNKVLPYVNPTDKTVVEELLKDASLDGNKKDVLIKDLKLINKEFSKIKILKNIKYAKTKLVDKRELADLLSNNKLDESFFENTGNDYKEAAIEVNKSIDLLVKSIESIINESVNYKSLLDTAVKQSESEINTFLKTAGIPYKFHLELVGDDEASTKLTPVEDDDYDLNDIRDHLSFGERNAISVALFGALAKSSDIDLIILDDPISSFDENKKFAIMNYLFNSSSGVLKDKTVVLFTHDFEPVIEAKNNVVNFGKKDRFVTVLSKNEGIVSEIEIHQADLVNAYKIEEELASDNSVDDYIRLIHLRKLYELKDGRCGDAYDIMSSAEHLRKIASDKKGLEYPESKILAGETYINNYIENFSYSNFVSGHSLTKLIELYRGENNSYNKLILLRAMDELLGPQIEKINPILYNFISINFHVESLYLYQLKKIDFTPRYIVDLCDSVVDAIENDIVSSKN